MNASTILGRATSYVVITVDKVKTTISLVIRRRLNARHTVTSLRVHRAICSPAETNPTVGQNLKIFAPQNAGNSDKAFSLICVIKLHRIPTSWQRSRGVAFFGVEDYSATKINKCVSRLATRMSPPYGLKQRRRPQFAMPSDRRRSWETLPTRRMAVGPTYAAALVTPR